MLVAVVMAWVFFVLSGGLHRTLETILSSDSGKTGGIPDAQRSAAVQNSGDTIETQIRNPGLTGNPDTAGKAGVAGQHAPATAFDGKEIVAEIADAKDMKDMKELIVEDAPPDTLTIGAGLAVDVSGGIPGVESPNPVLTKPPAAIPEPSHLGLGVLIIVILETMRRNRERKL